MNVIHKANYLTGLLYELVNAGYKPAISYSAGKISRLVMSVNGIQFRIKSQRLIDDSQDGEVDIDAIRKNAPELLQVIGLRIPNEDKYSTFNIVIKGFTPAEMGGITSSPLSVSGTAVDKNDCQNQLPTINAVASGGTPQYEFSLQASSGLSFGNISNWSTSNVFTQFNGSNFNIRIRTWWSYWSYLRTN